MRIRFYAEMSELNEIINVATEHDWAYHLDNINNELVCWFNAIDQTPDQAEHMIQEANRLHKQMPV